MSAPALTAQQQSLIVSVFRNHPEVVAAKLFGSRAKGTHTPQSDIDIALWGDIDALRAESIAAELDDLPIPCSFDVKPFALIKLQALREHIERVGIVIFPHEPLQTAATTKAASSSR